MRSMTMPTLSLAAAGLLLLAGCEVDDEPRPADDPDRAEAELPECDEDDGGLTLAEGFCALVVHDGVGSARHMVVSDEGDIYVRLREAREGGSIVALRDTTPDGRADVVEHFGGDEGGTGIGLHRGYLYFSTNTEVRRWALDGPGAAEALGAGAPGDRPGIADLDEEDEVVVQAESVEDDEMDSFAELRLVPDGEWEVVVGGFPDQESHAAKPFTFDGAGGIYVNVGSPTNACQPLDQDREPRVDGQDPCPEFPEQAAIWRFEAEATDQQQGPDGEPYVIGFRNAVALDWNHDHDALYAVQHGRDLLDAKWPEHYTEEENAELPSEEFHRLERGDTLAYPYCYHDPHRGAYVRAPEYGGDGETAEGCEGYRSPITAYPAHFSPNDLHFYRGNLFPDRYRGAAFIAWHGSWNRAPLEQRGYKVTVQRMNAAGANGDFEVFADGFASERPIASPADADHRPMGLAEGPDGSLYVVDSKEGKIWRIIPHGNGGTAERDGDGR